jgi:hypothetical protein
MLLAQLVKAVMEGMANVATPMPTPPTAPIISTVSKAATATQVNRMLKWRESGLERLRKQ